VKVIMGRRTAVAVVFVLVLLSPALTAGSFDEEAGEEGCAQLTFEVRRGGLAVRAFGWRAAGRLAGIP